jgi:hypothetical protein
MTLPNPRASGKQTLRLPFGTDRRPSLAARILSKPDLPITPEP